MSKMYDNWERLVEAVIRREQLREIALQDSMSLSNASISSELWREHSQRISLDSRSRSSDFKSYEFSFSLNSHISTQDDLLISDKIVPIEGCSFPWNREDLFGASAEKLGRGTLGSTYKVMLNERTTLIVKRLRELKIPIQEFEQQIQFLGSIRHENVVPVIAYFYFEETKCLIYDFCKQSVGSMLHDKIGKNLRPLGWYTRRRIAIGTARGLAHIHAQHGGKLVHGNINPSNIFLNSQQYGCISDHCLVTIGENNDQPPMPDTGYHAPEVIDFRQVSQASDVYSFGVLLLELLTRKSHDHAKLGNKVVGLVTWVNYMTSKKGTSKVFDSKLVKSSSTMEEEMLKMLLIGMHCVAGRPERRPKMPDILRMMECWEQ